MAILAPDSSSHRTNMTHIELVPVCMVTLCLLSGDTRCKASKCIDEADFLGAEVGCKGRGVEFHSLSVRVVDNLLSLKTETGRLHVIDKPL